MRTARSGRRRAGWTSATARSHSASRSERCSACGRSTMRSRRSGVASVHRLDSPVRAALRLGAYQLGYVDGVPRYAAVNESVELVRAAGLERAVAFTNAVLRRLADGIDELLEGLPGDERRARRRSSTRIPTGSRRRGGAISASRQRASSCAHRTSPPRSPFGSSAERSTGTADPEIPGAWHVERVDERRARGGPHLAAEPRLPARRAGRRCARWASARSTSAPLPAARRRCSRVRSSRWT